MSGISLPVLHRTRRLQVSDSLLFLYSVMLMPVIIPAQFKSNKVKDTLGESSLQLSETYHFSIKSQTTEYLLDQGGGLIYKVFIKETSSGTVSVDLVPYQLVGHGSHTLNLCLSSFVSELEFSTWDDGAYYDILDALEISCGRVRNLDPVLEEAAMHQMEDAID